MDFKCNHKNINIFNKFIKNNQIEYQKVINAKLFFDLMNGTKKRQDLIKYWIQDYYFIIEYWKLASILIDKSSNEKEFDFVIKVMQEALLESRKHMWKDIGLIDFELIKPNKQLKQFIIFFNELKIKNNFLEILFVLSSIWFIYKKMIENVRHKCLLKLNNDAYDLLKKYVWNYYCPCIIWFELLGEYDLNQNSDVLNNLFKKTCILEANFLNFIYF